MDLTAIITAHNEERTLGPLLDRFCSEPFGKHRLRQITVVSSASTDGTDELVLERSRRDPRIQLLTEPVRRGKCAAINWALELRERADVVLLSSADVLPAPGSLVRLITPFADPWVGMTGGRPVPSNDPKTFFGFAAHLLWRVHHRIALRHPKLGELVAFRDVLEKVPEELAVDEAAIEAAMRQRGLKLVYVPEAIVHNRGAETLQEFLSQRRRISAGHSHLEKQSGYEVSTASLRTAAFALLREMRWTPRGMVWSLGTAALCLWGRVLGVIDHRWRRRTHQVWDIAASTKHDVGEPAPHSGS